MINNKEKALLKYKIGPPMKRNQQGYEGYFSGGGRRERKIGSGGSLGRGEVDRRRKKARGDSRRCTRGGVGGQVETKRKRMGKEL